MLELKSTIVKLLQKENRFIPKRELCEKLHIKGAKRRDLKRILRELEQEGLYVRRKTTNLSVEVHKKHIKQEKYGSKKPFLSDCQSQTYLGVVCRHGHHLFLESVDRRRPFDPIAIDPKKFDDQQKEIKIGDVLSLSLNENTENSVLKHIGSFHEAQMFSLLEIIKSGVVYEFSEQAKREAQKGKIPSLKGRKDYRQIPLVTIDGVDARDFDDAVFAKPDDTPDNPKGWYVIVAIADVAHYVKSGGILDQEAYARGNSIYFPDRVVPMLPEALSNEMCSLKAGEDRACLAVEMRISKKGDLLSFEFHRGLMRSHHRLTYENVQQFLDQEKKIFDTPCDQTLWDQILDPLYGVYQVLQKKRDKRGALHLESIERKVIFHPNGKIKEIIPKIQTTSHKIIEELMIAANIAAAKTLDSKKWPALYRVHDKPDALRVQNLKQMVCSLGLSAPKEKNLSPHDFNKLLDSKTPFKRMLHDVILRTQAQAVYSPKNIGHFGLGLTHYTHFTSPIRRYSDLLVHRALIQALTLGTGGQDPVDLNVLQESGSHLSATERKAAQMERDVMDRYQVSYLESYIGMLFDAVIVGVTPAGLFFELQQTGAQGFLHKSALPNDYYVYDEPMYRYVGRRTRRSFQLGDLIQVILEGADVQSGKTTFTLAEFSSKKIKQKATEKEQKPRQKKEGVLKTKK